MTQQKNRNFPALPDSEIYTTEYSTTEISLLYVCHETLRFQYPNVQVEERGIFECLKIAHSLHVLTHYFLEDTYVCTGG